MIGKLTPRNKDDPELLDMADEPRLTPRYTNVAIVLHWLVALLIIANLVLGLVAEDLPEDQIRFAIDTHKSIGISVLGLVLLRILWRLGHKPPPFSEGMAPWERGLAHAAHGGLYLFMLWMPLTGWLHDSAWKAAPEIPMTLFGLFEWPRIGFVMALPDAEKERLHELFGSLHEIGGYLLIALILIHLAGALKHQLLDHQAEFRRMWPR
jgi:cytochrome b561